MYFFGCLQYISPDSVVVFIDPGQSFLDGSLPIGDWEDLGEDPNA